MQSAPPALAKSTLPALSKPVAFTSTKVPKFSGETSWDQYRQVFDAIVRSNGCDDATVALQLLSHLKGDALNVALLVPERSRATRGGGIDRTLWFTRLVGVGVSSRERLLMRGRTRRHLPSLWRHLQLKRLGTWARTHDCDLYWTGSSPVMRTAHCVDTLTAFPR